MVITKPIITEDNEYTVLSASYVIGQETRTIWYKTKKTERIPLCVERSDPFLVALLPYAMSIGEDIVTEAPVSLKLLHALRTYQIPYMCKMDNRYKHIDISAEADDTILFNKGHIGTSISCGVDSLSTIVTETVLEKEEKYRIDTLALFNAGHYGNDLEKSNSKFGKYVKNADNFCKEHGFDLLIVESNVGSLFPNDFTSSVSFLILSVVLALQKYFSVYYFASTYSLFQVEPIFEDSESYDFITTQSVNTENISVYSACAEKTRVEKTELLTQHPEYFKHIYPCVRENPPHNCGYCEKCRYTIMALDILGKMDAAKEVFDLSFYNKHRTSLYAYMLLHRRQAIDRINAPIYQELYFTLRQKGKRLPIGTRLFIPYQFYAAKLKKPLRQIIKRILIVLLGEKRAMTFKKSNRGG